ncbi:MAG TPA: DUF881 domain-containing protein [Marmoricola sp.]|nr:DUF881 domain-containing protein [Marmoricola sp.]
MTANPPTGGGQLPPQVTMGLLAYLSAYAYDEDYETVALRRAGEQQVREHDGSPASRRAPIWSRGLVAGIVLLAFAVLVVTAGTQTSRNAVALSDERKDLIAQINDRNAALRHEQQRVVRLQVQNRELSRQVLATDAEARRTVARVQRLSVVTGAQKVRGPGVAVVVDDARHAANDRDKVLDSDLQRLVNGLWEAGAEAIAINGQRLTNLTAIRKAGSAITVNYHSLSRPYRVLAIGNPDTLPARFAETSDGQAWFDLEQQVGLRFEIHTRQALTLPGARTALRYARPVHEGGTP